MTARVLVDRMPCASERPAFQWDASRVRGTHEVRLFGCLGPHEIEQVAESILERGRCPRDLVVVDFEQVTHVDYRALPAFARALARQDHRGAVVCLVGISRYVRRLFDVSGEGPALRRYEWMPVKEVTTPRRPLLSVALANATAAGRGGVWR